MNPSRRPQQQTVGGHNVEQVTQYTPEQMNLFRSLFSHVGPDSYLSKVAAGDPQLMAQMERRGLRDFGELQGNIASRFSGLGSGGRHSSGFQNEMGKQASTFAENLQAQRQQFQMNALQQLMGMSNQLLGQRPNENLLVKPQDNVPWWQKAIFGGAIPAAGAAAGAYFGGPGGAAVGYNVGKEFGSNFM